MIVRHLQFVHLSSIFISQMKLVPTVSKKNEVQTNIFVTFVVNIFCFCRMWRQCFWKWWKLFSEIAGFTGFWRSGRRPGKILNSSSWSWFGLSGFWGCTMFLQHVLDMDSHKIAIIKFLQHFKYVLKRLRIKTVQ